MGWFFNRNDDGSPEAQDEEDPSELNDQRFQQELLKREKALNKVGNEIQKQRNKYQEYLHKGARTDSSARRQVFAMKARLEKYKGNLNKLKQLKILRDISEITLVRGQAEIKDMLDDITSENELLGMAVTDPEEFQEEIDEAEAELKADIDNISETMAGMKVETGDLGFEQTEEHELMEEIAAGDRDVEQVVDDQTDDLLSSLDHSDESDNISPKTI